MNCKPILVVLSLLVFGSNFFAQNSAFVSSDPAHPLVKRHHRVFNMNQYSAHVVMYLVFKPTGYEQESTFTDSLRYANDTLLLRACDRSYVFCSDTLIPKGEPWCFLNGSYWQKLPLNRLIKIKSKQQPIARITSVATGVAIVTFVGGLVAALAIKNERVSNTVGAIAIISDLSMFPLLASNVWLGKKRFKFHKFKGPKKTFITF